jgi:hypothetical protein
MQPTAQAIRSTPVPAEAAAINPVRRWKPIGGLIYRNREYLDSFQSAFGSSLESLEKGVFPFASACGLEYRWRRITEGSLAFS